MSGRCDLELLIVPHDGHLEGVLRFAPDRYDRDFARTLVRHYLAEVSAAASAEGLGP